MGSYFYLMALTNSPYVRGVGQGKKSQPTCCVSVNFGFTQTCISGLILLDPEDVKSRSPGAVWAFTKGTGLP